MASGGKREGAGRPETPEDERRKPMTIHLPERAQIELHAQAALLGMSPGERIELWIDQNGMKSEDY